MASFLKWLLGMFSILTGIYCSFFFPDHWFLPQKFVIGFFVVMISGMCYSVLIPARIVNVEKNDARNSAIFALLLLIILQRFHPEWLSGRFFGWVTPIFPAVMLIVGLVALFKVYRKQLANLQ